MPCVRGTVVIGVMAAAAPIACFRGDFLDNTCEKLPGGCADGDKPQHPEHLAAREHSSGQGQGPHVQFVSCPGRSPRDPSFGTCRVRPNSTC